MQIIANELGEKYSLVYIALNGVFTEIYLMVLI